MEEKGRRAPVNGYQMQSPVTKVLVLMTAIVAGKLIREIRRLNQHDFPHTMDESWGGWRALYMNSFK